MPRLDSTMGLFVLGCLLPAFWVSFLATWAVRFLAPRWGLIDKPAARKFHVTPTPLGGGIGIICGVVVPLLAAQGLYFWVGTNSTEWSVSDPFVMRTLDGVAYRSPQLWTVIGAALVLSVVGLMDDFRPMGWRLRLGLQFLMAGVVVAAGVRATVFVQNPWIGAVLSVAWFVVLVNSFNFLDNMDGLSSGIALIVSGVFAVMMLTGGSEPRWLVAGFFLILAGSLLGFLCHNWSPARIFMGDCGSYFIGFSIASMTVLGTFYTKDAADRHVMLAPFCVLAIPLYDITSVVVLRLREGRSPFQPDKRHFSHRLVAMGLRPVHAVLTVHLATLTMSLGGIVLYSVPSWSAATVPLAMVACVLLIIAVLESAQRPNPE